MNNAKLEHRIFVVDKIPHCLWYWGDIRKLNLEFIERVEPGYFQYLAEIHTTDKADEEEQPAAIALRTAYSHGLETLFALLGAAVQAPKCVIGWMTKYRNSDLNRLVKRIQERRPLLSIFIESTLSWDAIAKTIHSYLVLDDKEKESRVVGGYKKLWANFAGDFLDTANSQEYNSIKHGLRARPGGFWVSIGAEESPGVPAPKEKMALLGQSDYGSSFWTSELLSKNKKLQHHFGLNKQFKNWNPLDLAYGLHLLAFSINNVICFLKIVNGIDSESIRYQWPLDLEDFSKPWELRRSLGVTAMKISSGHVPVPEKVLSRLSKAETLARYKQLTQENSPGEH